MDVAVGVDDADGSDCCCCCYWSLRDDAVGDYYNYDGDYYEDDAAAVDGGYDDDDDYFAVCWRVIFATNCVVRAPVGRRPCSCRPGGTSLVGSCGIGCVWFYPWDNCHLHSCKDNCGSF